ncbi:hypothetical protein BDV29DRAFT_171887 [Aspergillus leporis]|jgi:hypothetical protein|uniref:Uncharacterized protein n=1 Tax=Aspergillus leporis TaxID=41062 RepID=A0A5N5X4F3_9EURO|nr:hypothetical protein BDV29DRAFT_171887 [Aspergillus leporis]
MREMTYDSLSCYRSSSRLDERWSLLGMAIRCCTCICPGMASENNERSGLVILPKSTEYPQAKAGRGGRHGQRKTCSSPLTIPSPFLSRKQNGNHRLLPRTSHGCLGRAGNDQAAQSASSILGYWTQLPKRVQQLVVSAYYPAMSLGVLFLQKLLDACLKVV